MYINSDLTLVTPPQHPVPGMLGSTTPPRREPGWKAAPRGLSREELRQIVIDLIG
jgi:hypothetical protein